MRYVLCVSDLEFDLIIKIEYKLTVEYSLDVCDRKNNAKMKNIQKYINSIEYFNNFLTNDLNSRITIRKRDIQ